MGQIHSDRRKIESSYKKYKYSKHTSEIDVNQQHCTLPGSKHESMNKKILYQSQSGNMDDINDQTNTVNTGASNSTENVFQNSSDDCDTVQELSSINLDTPSTSIQCASMKKDESSVQKNISFEKSVSENTEISQIKNDSSSTGTVVKPQKSLHRFCNITSNLRRSNAKSLFTPKRHKSVKSAHEINSCFNNTDTSKGSFNKKKRSNWVTRFNCTKLKCNKSTDHHSLSNSVTNVEKQSSNANCVCMCYRKKAENVLMSDIKLHNENSVTNQIATQSNPQVNSIISVTVQNLSNERVRRMCRPVEYQSNSVDSINITEYRYRAVRKSSIPTLASNSSENNLITMCKCSNSNSCCSPLNIRGETSTDSRRKLHHRSVTTVNNSVSHHNDNRDIYNITEVTDSKLNSVFNVLPNRDNIQNQSSEISGSESLYGSLSDINNPQIVLDMPIDLVRLTDCNSDAATINNHTSNCVQMLYSKGTDSPHRCMQLVCHSDEISNRSNLTNHSNSQCSHNMSDDCFKQSNGHCSLEPQLNSEIHNRQTNSSNIEENTENSSQNSNDQSVHAHVNSSGSEQHVCSNKIIIPGQRRCLQLMCPTDISMESLKILFQSHFSSDTVVKCHTQIDYVHYLVPDLLQITSCSFYWGKMDRYEAERLLDGKPEGTFLLRDSAQEEFLFSVSFRKYGRSLHARIEQWNHKFSFDSHDPGVYSSSTVCGLIEHYKDPTCCMFFEPILTLPLHRNFTFTLQHLCRATITNKLKYDMIDLLQLPNVLKSYLKEYHYRQRVRVKRFDGGELQWVDYSAS